MSRTDSAGFHRRSFSTATRGIAHFALRWPRHWRAQTWRCSCFDYRGFGGNPGSPTEAGLKHDARAARAYVISRPDVDPQRIVYFGESLGTAVAADLAVDHPPAALILRSPFTSLTDVGRHHYRVSAGALAAARSL